MTDKELKATIDFILDELNSINREVVNLYMLRGSSYGFDRWNKRIDKFQENIARIRLTKDSP